MKTVAVVLLLVAALAAQSVAPSPSGVALYIRSGGTADIINQTDKSILLVEAQIGTAGGKAMTFYSHDYFFHVPIGPGVRTEIAHYGEDVGTLTEYADVPAVDSNGKLIFTAPDTPKMVHKLAQITFVQWVDGTTWGTASNGTIQGMAKRKMRLDSLHRWLTAYQSGGESGFVAALQAETENPGKAKYFLDTASKVGVSAAVAQITALAAAGDALMATGKF